MILTPNLNLKIPEYGDPASIKDAFHDNLTMIDSKCKELQDENERLKEALANKVNTRRSFTGQDITDVAYLPSGYYAVSGNITGMPIDNLWWIIELINTNEISGNGALTIKATRMSGLDTSTYIKNRSGDTWSPWVRLATAEPPQTYNLPLATGVVKYEGLCQYFKAQNNKVSLLFHVRGETDNDFSNRLIATLPEGFRPTAAIWSSVGGTTGGSDVSVRLKINPDGTLYLRYSGTTLTAAMGEASFLATQ